MRFKYVFTKILLNWNINSFTGPWPNCNYTFEENRNFENLPDTQAVRKGIDSLQQTLIFESLCCPKQMLYTLDI